MHSAPSVSYPVGPTRGLGLVFLALCAASLGGILLWCYQSDSVDARQGFGLLAWGASCALAWRSWRQFASGRIHWNGESWTWELPASDVAGRVSVSLDLQSVMLLRWQALEESAVAAVPVWLWVASAASTPDWLAMRRAVYSRPHSA